MSSDRTHSSAMLNDSCPSPLISVLMPVYNSEQYLEQAIESILNQTYSHFELIIINDGSTDNTLQILEKYDRRDSRIKLIQNEQNIGLTKSLNRGLQLVQGQYVARQDGDDIALPERFERQITILEQNPDVVLVSCDLEVIDAEGKLLPYRIERSCDTQLVSWYLLFCNYIAGHSQVMFRRQVAVDAGGYCEAYRYSQDYELWSRLIQQGWAVILPTVLQQQRMHQKSISAQKRTEQRRLSLVQSQRNLQQLVGTELSIDEVKDLRGLMLIPKDWYDFPDLNLPRSRASTLHKHLKKIYQAFVQQPQYIDDQTIAFKVSSLISSQFLCWIQHLSFRKNWPLKLQILFYAFLWSPKQTIRLAWRRV